jgi:hypothetical protein
MRYEPSRALRAAFLAGLATWPCAVALASSHREAPNITTIPKVDGTDFYMFRSYEPGREGFVTIVADYLPLQDPYGGPNYFTLDPNALYEIHLDTNGDAVEDLTFQFRFQNDLRKIALAIGPEGAKKSVAIPLILAGQITGDAGTDPLNPAVLNVLESYTVDVVRGDRRTGERASITNSATGAVRFAKPVDNIGLKSIPDYEAYARNFVHEIRIPGCEVPGRVFVGQRKDPFVVNLGETFDLINLNPIGPENGETDTLADKNVTSLILELPISCLVAGDPVIGGWTTASLRQGRVLNPDPDSIGAEGGKEAVVDGGAWVQVSRLGQPLVNEVVIGLEDKDRFNAGEPKDDGRFATYVTHPTLPALIEVLFSVPAPTLFPRQDLVTVFLTGVPDLNQPASVVPSEMLRLNTAIAPTAKGAQSRLGVLGGDLAGFPNGRRPGDDVVDMALRVVMGVLLSEDLAPAGKLPLTDGAFVDDSAFDAAFPYLRTPIAGSPQN